MNAESKCPMGSASRRAIARATTNAMWWPDRLDLSGLRRNDPSTDPHGAGFDYKAAFAALDLKAVKADIFALMTESQAWWPADYGHYGPLFIRMAWHSAGTYRIFDGRGGGGTGQQRFAPLNSWPDNGNLDKARMLLWPVKQKYGRALSWADLMILAGNCALESMGFPTVGFAGGRADSWQPDDTNWGGEAEWLGDQRYTGERQLDDPLGAVQMGLIYVNPEGPNANPDPVASGRDIRETFARMAMNDEETVALIAGGHAFGKAHGAGDAGLVGPAPEGAPIEAQGLGWANAHGSGRGVDTITSGIEGAWTETPTRWDNNYLKNLFEYDWELTRSPAGAHQWRPTNPEAQTIVPDAHDPAKRHAPMMTTADLALRFDPIYEPIARRFYENPKALEKAFGEAWFKLTHRDMGPIARYVGAEVPAEPRIWQDPVPPVDHPLVTASDIAALKREILASGLSVGRLVKTAWASASTFRNSDKRGGANGARIRLAPQKDWAVNEPAELARTLAVLEGIKARFDASAPGGRRISLADLIVLGGAAAIEAAATAAGHRIEVPFHPGRTDATAEMTDAHSFAVLEPRADPFRNYAGDPSPYTPEGQMVDKAQLLGLSVPELTALVGGLRVLGANHGDSRAGLFTDRVGALTNDWFRNLLAAATGATWRPSAEDPALYTATCRTTGKTLWTASRIDLLFGSHSELRATAEAFAEADGEALFRDTFVKAWTKVMEADRFDLH